jgi:hypothetical protein
VKAVEALLLAVMIFGIVAVGAAIIISAARRNPGLKRALRAAEADRDLLEALVNRIYKITAKGRDVDPLATYVAGEIEQAQAKRGK